MKKFYKCIALFLGMLLAALAMTSFTEAPTTDFSPKASPDGKLMTPVSTYDFDTNGFGFTYSGTHVLAHNAIPHEGNVRYRLLTPGGGLQPNVLAYSANGDDLTNAAWVSLYVDATNLANADAFSIGIRLNLAKEAALSYKSTAAAPLLLQDGTMGYYRTQDGDWKKATVTDGQITLSDDFCGYVAFPLSAFRHTKESGWKYLEGCSTFSDVAASGYKYLCRTYFYCTISDPWESVTPIFLDDLTFYSVGEAHTHTLQKGETVAPDCSKDGYTVYTCTGCGENIAKDVQSRVAHTYTDYKTTSDGIAYHICTFCDRVETNGSITNAPAGNDDLVTVTFHHGAAGGKDTVKFKKGHTITQQDIPCKMTYVGRYTYQFNGWTTDPENICPQDPMDMTVDGDMTFYARYLPATYADKYATMVRAVSKSDGIYNFETGRTVVYGNSNMALYTDLEVNFAAAGIPAYNVSIAGSTSHDMIEYYKTCVLSYHPQYIVTNVTTNDMAYYNMSEKQIMKNMETLYTMTRELLPEATMFITAANPLPGRTEYTQTIERVNAQMKAFCDAHENCEYVDWYGKVLAYAKEYPTGWDTWTHLKQAGLKDIFNDVIAAIKAYEAE